MPAGFVVRDGDLIPRERWGLVMMEQDLAGFCQPAGEQHGPQQADGRQEKDAVKA
jgi:hypothetical protein